MDNDDDEFDRALRRDIERDKHHKVPIRFIAIGRAPILKQQIYKISSSQSVSTVTDFLRTRLRLGPDDAIFVYLNDSFTPAPEENLLNLHNCFKIDGQLVFSYSLVPAFG